ncbi:hypothetical protein CU098_005131, partial [Rhizopus stolonifer]
LLIRNHLESNTRPTLHAFKKIHQKELELLGVDEQAVANMYRKEYGSVIQFLCYVRNAKIYLSDIIEVYSDLNTIEALKNLSFTIVFALLRQLANLLLYIVEAKRQQETTAAA